MNISVIFPCFNEDNNIFFHQALKSYSQFKTLDIICVDGSTSKATLNIVKHYPNVKYINLKNSSRAQRLNVGLEHAQADVIILHHPRSILDPKAFEKAQSCSFNQWGGFQHQFDQKSWLYSFTSWYSNHIRLKYRNIVYLDHCIVLHRSLLQLSPLMPDVKVFEDTLLSKKLNQVSKPKLFKAKSTTSSIRFKKNGIFKQVILNQIAKVLFMLGVSPNTIDTLYEKNLSLNSEYKHKL